MEESKELGSVKKQKERLLSELKHLLHTLQEKEVAKDKQKPHKGLKDIISEVEQELEYVDKHIKRMKDSGSLKRSFIKKGVRRKVGAHAYTS